MQRGSGKRLARDYHAESDIEGAWQALKRTNRLVGGRFIIAARVLIDKFGDDGVETVRDAMRRWGRMRGEHLRAEHEEAGIPISPASFMRHHDLPFSTVWDIEEIEASDECFHAVMHDTPHDEAWRDMDADPVLGPVWYECSYVSMREAYLRHARLEWKTASSVEATTSTRSASSGASRPRRRNAVSGYLSITAVAAISTRNSGLTRPACTQARAGGFSGKIRPVDLVHRLVVAEVREEDHVVHNVFQGAPGRSEYRLDVLHDLPGLRARVVFADQIPRRVHRQHPRRAYELTGPESGRIGRQRGRRSLGQYGLTSHRAVPPSGCNGVSGWRGRVTGSTNLCANLRRA